MDCCAPHGEDKTCHDGYTPQDTGECDGDASGQYTCCPPGTGSMPLPSTMPMESECSPGCWSYQRGNQWCDEQCQTPECDWDDGDCPSLYASITVQVLSSGELFLNVESGGEYSSHPLVSLNGSWAGRLGAVAPSLTSDFEGSAVTKVSIPCQPSAVTLAQAPGCALTSNYGLMGSFEYTQGGLAYSTEYTFSVDALDAETGEWRGWSPPATFSTLAAQILIADADAPRRSSPHRSCPWGGLPPAVRPVGTPALFPPFTASCRPRSRVSLPVDDVRLLRI